MSTAEVNAITGAFGYTGKYITRRLLAMGKEVRTLTGHPNNFNPFGGRVQVYPFNFDNFAELVRSLQGAATFYNTYWIRFSHGINTFEGAVRNTQTLIRAAVEAGVQRIVHVSITNPAETSRFPYFCGKAILEQDIINSGLSYTIVRPTVIFGDEDILINNIAWCLRHFPVFPIFGSGEYSLQPIYVEDMADLVVEADQGQGNSIVDAVGPEIFTVEQLVRLIMEKLRKRVILTHVNPHVALFLTKMIEPFLGDVLITREEVFGLMADLLISQQPPTGRTRLSDWLEEHSANVGKNYASELARHYR